MEDRLLPPPPPGVAVLCDCDEEAALTASALVPWDAPRPDFELLITLPHRSALYAKLQDEVAKPPKDRCTCLRSRGLVTRRARSPQNGRRIFGALRASRDAVVCLVRSRSAQLKLGTAVDNVNLAGQLQKLAEQCAADASQQQVVYDELQRQHASRGGGYVFRERDVLRGVCLIVSLLSSGCRYHAMPGYIDRIS